MDDRARVRMQADVTDHLYQQFRRAADNQLGLNIAGGIDPIMAMFCEFDAALIMAMAAISRMASSCDSEEQRASVFEKCRDLMVKRLDDHRPTILEAARDASEQIAAGRVAS